MKIMNNIPNKRELYLEEHGRIIFFFKKIFL